MGFRETINRSQTAVIIISAIVVVVAAFYILRSTRTNVPDNDAIYLTDDEGKTFFPGKDSDVPPVDHNGKKAYRAYVFKNPKTGEKLVGYMERCTDQARPVIVKLRAWKAGDPPPTQQELTIVASGHEFRRPTDKTWTNGTDDTAMRFMQNIILPDGTQAVPLRE